MKFEDSTPDDREMRQRVLTEMLAVDRAVQRRHIREFSVVRTVNRKDYRHPQKFNSNGPYSRDDQRTLVTVIIEVPDDVTLPFKALVADIAKMEADGIRAVKEARLADAVARAEKAQEEVDRLREELSGEATEGG